MTCEPGRPAIPEAKRRHWTDNAPRSLLNMFTDSNGAPCFTSLDRRWLWRLADTLAVAATTDILRDLRRDLEQYLHETCDHHMIDYLTCCEPRNETCIAPHRQCTWCNHVEWVGADT